MKYSVVISGIAALIILIAGEIIPGSCEENPKILEVRKIWDKAAHNAFTDLIRFNNKWYCTFREADSHYPAARGSKEDGKIRIIESDDARNWTSAGLLVEKGVDLRDPKLSITADGKLMINAGGSVYVSKTPSPERETRIGLHTRVAFSNDGRDWSSVQKIRGTNLMTDQNWLWRVTWHKGYAYGFTKHPAILRRSKDGITYEPIGDSLEVADEITVRFLPDDKMMALFRRPAAIGISKPPYTNWDIYRVKQNQIGGPNFIVLPNGQIWAGSRNSGNPTKTILVRMNQKQYETALELPSGGDTSYPGFVWYNGLLWMSYYSSHEGKTAIYLAEIKTPEM